MPKLPNAPPPRRLAQLLPSLHVVPARSTLWRIYFRAGAHPTVWDQFRSFGPTPGGRFDHHEPPPGAQARAILYAATEIATCVAEVFQRGRVINRHRGAPWLAGFENLRDLNLLDLSGTWPTAAGTSMAINTGPRGRAQRWSRAVYAAYPEIEGLWYCSSMHANRPAIALYERAEGSFAPTPIFNRPLHDPALLGPLRVASHALGYGLV